MAALVLALSAGVAAAATTKAPTETNDEVMHLLKFVQESGCEFNRNNSRHNAKDAREHLELKYTTLAKRGLIEKAEDFIERGASQSSMSGQAYQIRCADGKSIPSARWLTEELRMYRGGKK
ncbi:MAG: DUF5329 domain-containing protein [Usitatibacteraceae bacterium]